MSETNRNTLVGTAGGNINVDLRPLDHATPKKVQLSADYTPTYPPGYPTPPWQTGAEQKTAARKSTQTITNGTTITLLKAEADALIAAGKATAV